MTSCYQGRNRKTGGPRGHLPVSMLGIPTDRNSSYRRGAKLAPGCVRKIFSSGMSNLTIDMDGLDPAYAPGVSYHEPGGLTTREVITLIWTLPGSLISGDIVEYNPRLDLNDMTAAVVMKLIKKMIARIVRDLGG